MENSDLHFQKEIKKKEALWGLYNTALISRSKQLKNNTKKIANALC